METVSAIVCTRGRAAPVVRAVQSLLADERDGFELIVIDQSDDSNTEQALKSVTDARLRYFHSASRGKGAGLNEAARHAKGSILVLTDDDCIVPKGWALDMASLLAERAEAVVAFCRVVPVPHDRTEGYVPAYEMTSERTLRSVTAVRGGLGLGAAMALRRDFVLSMGGFDQSFGPGGRFPSADEWDICLRALLTGHHVYETPALEVIHDGFRTFAEGRTHARRDWLALGAVCAKPLRAGYLNATFLSVSLFSRQALWPPIEDLLRLRRPRGFGRIEAFVRGFALGLLTPVDRKNLLFRPEPAAKPPS